MNYLVDSEAFIWWNIQPEALSARVNTLLADRHHVLWLSLASVWEMQIKTQLGKLILPAPLPTLIQQQREVNQFQLLAIELPHIFELSVLPQHHKDPFDRLMVAQERVENLPFITNDPQIQKYPVTTVW